MNDTHKQQLSSLLDNELSNYEMKELLAEIQSDHELNQTLDRYALIREVLSEEPDVHQQSFLKQVQAAIVAEPTVLAPQRNKSESKTYITAAIAASVAIFAVIVFNINNVPSVSPQQQSIASLDPQKEEHLALEEPVDDELIVNENTLRPQLVTFGR